LFEIYRNYSNGSIQQEYHLYQKNKQVGTVTFEILREMTYRGSILLEHITFDSEDKSTAVLDPTSTFLEYSYTGMHIYHLSQICITVPLTWTHVDPLYIEATLSDLLREYVEILLKYSDIYQDCKHTVLGTCMISIKQHLVPWEADRKFEFSEKVNHNDISVGRLRGTLIFEDIPRCIPAQSLNPPLRRRVSPLTDISSPTQETTSDIEPTDYSETSSTLSIRNSPRNSPRGLPRQISYVQRPPPIREGYMTKQGKIVKNWKRRWFILRENIFSYYRYPEKETLFEKDGKPRGTIILREFSVSVVYERKYCFKLIDSKKRRDYLIIADSDNELQEWILAIQLFTQNRVLRE